MNQSLSPRRLAGAAVSVFALALVGAPALLAQDNPCAQSEAVYITEVDIDGQVAEMTKALSLTAEQQEEIKPILISAAEEGQAIRAMYDDEDNDEADEKLEKLHKATLSQIGEVLTADQKKKLDAMVKMDHEETDAEAEAAENDMD